MTPKRGEQLEGYDPAIPPEDQTVTFGDVQLTVTNQRDGAVLWEYIPPKSNVIPIRPNSPDIPHETVFGIMVVTKGGVIRSIWSSPIKEYGRAL